MKPTGLSSSAKSSTRRQVSSGCSQKSSYLTWRYLPGSRALRAFSIAREWVFHWMPASATYERPLASQVAWSSGDSGP
jgi:hypothetical protein